MARLLDTLAECLPAAAVVLTRSERGVERADVAAAGVWMEWQSRDPRALVTLGTVDTVEDVTPRYEHLPLGRGVPLPVFDNEKRKADARNQHTP